MADRLRIDHFVTSALGGENIEQIFGSLAQALWVDWETGEGRVKRVHTSRVSQVGWVGWSLWCKGVYVVVTN